VDFLYANVVRAEVSVAVDVAKDLVADNAVPATERITN